MPPRYAFLDTNIFLHFVPFGDIDWPAELGADTVVLVITETVIDELDNKKDTHPLSTIRQRARAALQHIETIVSRSDAQSVRLNVTVAHHDEPPRNDIEQYGLNPAKPDHRLVAAILQHRELNLGADSVLVTDDTGPRLTALHRGIATHRPRSSLRLPDARDEADKKIQALERKVATLESRLPRLSVRFDLFDGQQEMVLVPKHADTSTEREAKIERLRARHRGIDTRRPAIRAALREASIDEIERYHIEAENYPSLCQEYVDACALYDLQQSLTFLVVPVLVNTGHGPATHARIGLSFPGDVTVLDIHARNEQAPEPPAVPTPPRNVLEQIHALSDGSALFSRAEVGGSYHALAEISASASRNFQGPHIERPANGKTTVTYSVERLQHGVPISLDPLTLRFQTQNVHPIQVSAIIHATELPDAAEQVIDILVRCGI